jgi:hypothetical protein
VKGSARDARRCDLRRTGLGNLLRAVVNPFQGEWRHGGEPTARYSSVLRYDDRGVLDRFGRSILPRPKSEEIFLQKVPRVARLSIRNASK